MGLFDVVKKVAWGAVTSVFKKAHFHWQNLNEYTDGEDKVHRVGAPYHGRCWFHPFGYSDPPTPMDDVEVGFEWNLWQKSHIGLSIRFDQDRDHHTTIGVGLPPFSFFFWEKNVIPREVLPKSARESGVRFHDDAIHVDVWNDPWCWSKDDHYLIQSPVKIPRSFSISPVDVLFGHPKYEDRVIRRVETVVPMPEGPYPALVTLHESMWTRPRSPFVQRMMRATVKPLQGIPVPGKGENSWDCGDTSVMESAFPARSIDDGVAAMVKSVLRTRTRYGGRDWKPSPASAAAAPGTEEDLPDPPGSELLGTD